MPDAYDEQEYQIVRKAVIRATLHLAPCERAQERIDLIGEMEAQFQARGAAPPPWMDRLREDLAW
jgi:hypothetical protein